MLDRQVSLVECRTRLPDVLYVCCHACPSIFPFHSMPLPRPDAWEDPAQMSTLALPSFEHILDRDEFIV